MVKPISLRLRQEALIAKARATLGSAREARLKQSHDAAVMQRAREIVAQAREQDRLRRSAKVAALRALVLSKDAYDRINDASSSEIDQKRWRESRELVEAELMRIVKGARP
jgi:hypothetical protein